MKYQFCILFLCAVVFGCKQTPTKTVESEVAVFDSSKLESVLDSIYTANPSSKGLMVHVEAPDLGVSWSGAAGVSDTITNNPIDAHQPALIASNTKTYTSVTILKLIEAGKLKLDQSIFSLISEKSSELLTDAGYDLETITVAHLLSHTSGIRDYVNEAYMLAIDTDKRHRWTRDEQIELSTKTGGPLWEPGAGFSYADVNFLLAAEIIEPFTGEPFHIAIANWIDFEKHGMKHTWFASLDSIPKSSPLLVHQYFGAMGWDSHELDPSFDLYGAGGIAAPTKDLALFSQRLFEGKIIEDPKVLDLIYTKMPIQNGEDSHYLMGLMDSEIGGYKAYGHGGFWGTVVQYIPELNTSIAVYVLERDHRGLRVDILETMVDLMANHQ